MGKEEVHYAYDGHTLKGQPSELATRIADDVTNFGHCYKIQLPLLIFYTKNLLLYVKMHPSVRLCYAIGEQ
jgi:hypothetical protein